MAITFPYRKFPSLPKEAQQQIWRDLEYLASHIHGSPSVFDAIIDPSLSASDASEHQYVNLTELIASETWDEHSMFNVGVRQRFDIAIIEPAETLDIRGVGDLSLFGVGNVQHDGDHLDWVWAQLQCNLTQQVFYYNLAIKLDSGTSF